MNSMSPTWDIGTSNKSLSYIHITLGSESAEFP